MRELASTRGEETGQARSYELHMEAWVFELNLLDSRPNRRSERGPTLQRSTWEWWTEWMISNKEDLRALARKGKELVSHGNMMRGFRLQGHNGFDDVQVGYSLPE